MIGCACWNLQQESAKVIFLAGVLDWLSHKGITLPRIVNRSCVCVSAQGRPLMDGWDWIPVGRRDPQIGARNDRDGSGGPDAVL